MLYITVIKRLYIISSICFSSSKMIERYQVWMGKMIKREAFSSLAILKMETKRGNVSGNRMTCIIGVPHTMHSASYAFIEKILSKTMGRELFVPISAHAFRSSMESTWMSSFLKKTAADARLFCSPNTPILFFLFYFIFKLKYSQ